ncbi:methyltransferase domain-containing protein [Streptomyces sp. NPDC088354]|uniref:methyltransferase domain-containing protein n=1 Tax=Streptomyces sp. NPDC088354 TaxID=3365856 RepID=UPI003808C0B0
MLDYETEAARYDATRGGTPRARAAAASVLGLVPREARTLLDAGCGTGLVTQRYARPGLRVLGADRAAAMAHMARTRVGPGVVVADLRRLPFAAGSLDAVSLVWVLHLLPFAPQVIAECARVLRPGGVLVTTVDKDAGHDVGSDIDALLGPFRRREPYDAEEPVLRHAAAHGLRPAGEARFTGHGQGRAPRDLAARIAAGRFASALVLGEEDADALAGRLVALPDQDKPRPDPAYRLIALAKDRDAPDSPTAAAR